MGQEVKPAGEYRKGVNMEVNTRGEYRGCIQGVNMGSVNIRGEYRGNMGVNTGGEYGGLNMGGVNMGGVNTGCEYRG